MNMQNNSKKLQDHHSLCTEPKLNVFLISYNQACFIEDCIKSILMQKTDFKFNVIIADDCSTDNTLDIIKRCASNSDVEFIFLENEKNLGVQENLMRAIGACNAEYIAAMEGDDLWIGAGRLQHHVNFLDTHLECSMSSNRRLDAHYDGDIIDFISPQPPLEEGNPQGFSYLTATDLIRLYNGGMNLSSCVYRKLTLDKVASGLLAKKYLYEASINIMAGTYGLIARHDEIMNVYRAHKSGIWSGLGEIGQLDGLLHMFDIMDNHTERKFGALFDEKRNHIRLYLKTVEFEPTEEEGVAISDDHVSKSKENLLTRLMLRTPPGMLRLMKALLPQPIKKMIRKLLLR